MKEARIIVCAKQVPDPEAPSSAIRVDPETKKIDISTAPSVLNPFDENAVEAAIRLKEELKAAELTVLSMGEEIPKAILNKALAAGIDKAVLLVDAGFADLVSHSIAYVLSRAIKKMGEYDLILTGRQAADWDSGQVGLILAEVLNIPSINLAQSVRIVDGNVVVKKVRPDGYELVKARLPALVTASHEIGELRYTSLAAIREARKKPREIWSASDLGIDPQKLRRVEIIKLYSPALKRKCHFIEGDSMEEKGENLALFLRKNEVV
jgi:electron transfer flavoprotein beta subunit